MMSIKTTVIEDYRMQTINNIEVVQLVRLRLKTHESLIHLKPRTLDSKLTLVIQVSKNIEIVHMISKSHLLIFKDSIEKSININKSKISYLINILTFLEKQKRESLII